MASQNYCVYTDTSVTAVTTLTTSVPLNVPMVANKWYELTVTTDTWYNQGANPTASAGSGSVFLGAGQKVLLNGGKGSKVALFTPTTAGVACVALAEMIR
jgi:hypothetical protein